MAEKVTVATTWLQSCSGCHIALLDLHEELLDVLKLIDIRYSTIVDIKEVPEVDVGLVEGAVANEDNEEILKTFREKAKTIDKITPDKPGYVRFKGEYWRARSDSTIDINTNVIIINKDETTLVVKPIKK